jgi:hypothetical protein
MTAVADDKLDEKHGAVVCVWPGQRVLCLVARTFFFMPGYKHLMWVDPDTAAAVSPVHDNVS